MSTFEIKLVEINNRSAVEFPDGTIVFQEETLGEFLRNLEMFAICNNFKLEDILYVGFNK